MLSPRRVMIVEDEEILAANLKAHLERASCEPRIATDGASAIMLAEAFVPDVVVLDYRLPDMTGFEVFDAIRHHARLYVLITGHPTSTVLKAARERGIESILFKPFPLAELSAVVCRPLPDGSAADADPAAQAERRHQTRDSFPIRLFDGTWLYADRRHHDGVEARQERRENEGND